MTINMQPMGGPPADICMRCGHNWHGLPCRQSKHTPGQLVQPCDCSTAFDEKL